MAAVSPPLVPSGARRQSVLIVDDEPVMRDTIEAIIRGPNWRIYQAESADEALQVFGRTHIDVAIVDIEMPGSTMDGIQLLEQVKAGTEQVEIIICTVDRNPRTALRAARLGAFDYLTKDYEHLHDLPQIVERALERQRDRREILYLRSQGRASEAAFVAPRSAAMRTAVETIRRVADLPTTVMLLGESGTGKELLARLLHQASPRAEKPFVAVNLAAVDRNLINSELFGHERGAFTGAERQHLGRFELADGGTLFLDEIGDVPLDCQGRMLRAIQEREIERVGGRAPVPVDVRVVCATNRNLPEMVQAGTFREDLYYRIHVVPVHVPPLRDRRDDIADLVHFFGRRYAALFHQPEPTFTEEAMATLFAHDWPGNVRELENLVQNILATSRGKSSFDEVDIPALAAINRLAQIRKPGEDLLRAAMRAFERQFLSRALDQANGNFAEASRYLGLPHTTLKYKCKKHNLQSRRTKK